MSHRILEDIERINSDRKYKDKRLDFTSGNLDYKGSHSTHKAATTDSGWLIWKYTYDVNDNVTRIEGPLTGAWDDRASLSWA